MKKVALIGITLILSTSLVHPASATGVWSDGDFQLGPPTTNTNANQSQSTTSLWSENHWTNESTVTPSTPPQPPAPVSQAVAKSQELVFDVHPITRNGRTLVPVRGILEPLGASFDWNSKEGIVTATKGSTVVKLQINSEVAFVNGREIRLEAPAQINQGRTLVPLRFISEAFGHKVDWDAATTRVTVDNAYYFFLDRTKKPIEKIEPQKLDSSFVGNWEIWVPGGYATTGSTLNGDGSTTIKQEYVQGAKGKTLRIKGDGSYTWEVVEGTIKGRWQAAENGRIILLEGQMDSDWYVELVDSKQIKIYAWGMTEYGTRLQ